MQWLGMDLNFQNTEKEFQIFETMYGKPTGVFIYATMDNEVVGGVAIRRLEAGICEMKRLSFMIPSRAMDLVSYFAKKLFQLQTEWDIPR